MAVETSRHFRSTVIFPLIWKRQMFTRITFKMKRLDPKTIHNFTKSFLGETGVMKCHQAECLAALLAIIGLSPGRTPKERTCYFWENRVELGFYLRRKYLLRAVSLLQVTILCTTRSSCTRIPFYRAWHNRPKKGVLWSYLCMFLITLLYTKKKKKNQIPRPKATILLIYAYMSAQMIIRLNLKTTGF